MPLTEKYLVYQHKNRANGKVYIGITRQTTDRRWQNGNGYKGTFFYNAIRKYGWDNFDHDILFSGLTKEQACEIEKALIKEYDSQNREKGYNICEGGQTGDNLRPMKGTDNYRAIGVCRIDPKTGERRVFATMHCAAEEMGINYRGISKNCKGLTKTYKGFVWEYIGRDVEKPHRYPIGKYPHDKQKKKVRMIDLDGTETVFDSLKEAGAFVGVKGSTISRYISGIRTDASGRGWSLCL